jgi:hypothetical protein
MNLTAFAGGDNLFRLAQHFHHFGFSDAASPQFESGVTTDLYSFFGTERTDAPVYFDGVTVYTYYFDLL